MLKELLKRARAGEGMNEKKETPTAVTIGVEPEEYSAEEDELIIKREKIKCRNAVISVVISVISIIVSIASLIIRFISR